MDELSVENGPLSLAKPRREPRMSAEGTRLYNPPMPIGAARRFALPLLAAVLVAGLYAAASWQNQFVYDDHEVIENQYPIRHLNDLGRIFIEPHYLNFPYYRPITRATFALQMSLWGRNPRAYHLFNAMLAGVLVVSAYALLRRPALHLHPLAALVAATWFGLHPAISECVYPAASGRETLLPAIFIILTMWAFLGPGIWWFGIAMVLFGCSLLSKEQAAVLPGLFLLADLLAMTAKPRRFSAWLGKYAPIVLIFVAYFVVRHLIFRQPTLHLTVCQHPLEPLRSILYGIQTSVTPFMALRYEPPFESWFDLRLSAISCAVVLFLLVAAAFAGKEIRRCGIFWLGWFVILQLPTAHIVQQEAAYSERYAALAILAFPAVVVTLVGATSSSRLRAAGAIAVAVWVFVAGCVSFLRGPYYTDDASFCVQWENTSPNASGPHDGLGRLAQERKQYSTAIDEYQKVLAIEPADATAHNNLANVLADAGDFAGASAHYEWLLNHNSTGADTVATMTNYAQLLGREAFDRNDQAMRDRAHSLLDEAIAMLPDYAQAHYVLGLWNVAFGSREAAIRQFKFALHLRPDWPEVEGMLQKLQEPPAASEASIPSTRR